jgi:Putative prokaryotic signal transducing protein
VLVPLTVVPNVYEAEMLCALLRTEGIACDDRPTNVGVGFADGWPSAGPREILVEEAALDRARELLAASKDA